MGSPGTDAAMPDAAALWLLPSGAVGGVVVATVAGAGASRGALEQAASSHRIAALRPSRPEGNFVMWVILLEALAALVLLALIVWWVMFSGRRKGERKRPDDSAP